MTRQVTSQAYEGQRVGHTLLVLKWQCVQYPACSITRAVSKLHLQKLLYNNHWKKSNRRKIWMTTTEATTLLL